MHPGQAAAGGGRELCGPGLGSGRGRGGPGGQGARGRHPSTRPSRDLCSRHLLLPVFKITFQQRQDRGGSPALQSRKALQVGPQSPFIVARSGRRVPAGTPSAEPPTYGFPPPRSGRFGERIPLSTQRPPDAPSPRREAPHSAAAAPRARPPAATSCRPPPRLCPPGTLPVRSRRPGRSAELPVPGPPVWRVSHAPVLLRAEQYSIARCASSICPGREGLSPPSGRWEQVLLQTFGPQLWMNTCSRCLGSTWLWKQRVTC